MQTFALVEYCKKFNMKLPFSLAHLKEATENISKKSRPLLSIGSKVDDDVADTKKRLTRIQKYYKKNVKSRVFSNVTSLKSKQMPKIEEQELPNEYVM